MNKFLLSVAAAASALAFALPVHAADLTPTFDVNINLTTGCVISTAPTAVNFSYSAFALAAVASTGGGFGVKCTKNLNYTLALDLGGSYTDQATDLAYTLTLSGSSATGSGAAQSYTIAGSMAANQGGTCAASGATCTNAASTNKTRTLTVSY